MKVREYKESLISYFEDLGIKIKQDEILDINGIKVPNYFLYPLNDNNFEGYLEFEFLSQLKKIYTDHLIYNRSCYESHSCFIQPDDIVFDCGGNMGLFSIYAASKAKQVVTFEPMPLVQPYLRNTCEPYDNITIIQKAVGAENKIEIFNQCDNLAASHYSKVNCNYFESIHNIVSQEQCEIITLDSFIKESQIFPSFIKADIEGSEFDMLMGAKDYISEYKPKLSIVPHGEIAFKEIYQYLKSNYKDYYFNVQSAKDIQIILGESQC